MEPESIEFLCEGDVVCGRFYQAAGVTNPVTLLFVPGWPGDAEDFLGLGPRLSDKGINVLEFYPRGCYQSEGIYTHQGGLQDIAAALDWLRQPEMQKMYNVDPERLILAGFSNGGGLAMAYAAGNPNMRYLISCAANDFGQFSRELDQHRSVAYNPKMEYILAFLRSTLAPEGPAHFDLEGGLQELIDHPEIFGLRESASKLANRSILMFGGWEDLGPTIEDYQLPLYRALKAAGAEKVTFIVYHTTHNFSNVRQRLADDIAGWISQQFPAE